MTTDTLMDDLFASVSFDKTLPWQDTPATFEDGEDVQMSAILKFNPNHAPAGSPIGGQFISATGGIIPKEEYSGENRAEYRALLDEYLSYKKDAPKELSDRIDAMMAANRLKRTEWERYMQREISHGRVSPQQARELGLYGNGDTYKPLPPVLYHVTTAGSAVTKQGLKTREELGQQSGVGLGGGTSDTISFTDDKKIADAIQEAMLIGHDYFNDKLTTADMVEEARKGGWLSKLGLFYGSGDNTYPGTDLPYGVYQTLHAKKLALFGYGYTEAMLESSRQHNSSEYSRKLHTGMKLTASDKARNVRVGERDADPEEQFENKAEFFKKWLAAREAATGKFDPLFFASDLKAFAARPRSDIQLLEYAPINKKVVGYQVGGMAEWRVHTGDIVRRRKAKKYEAVLKFNPYHDERGRFTTSDNDNTGSDEITALMDPNRSPIEGMSPHMNAISTLTVIAKLQNVSENEPVKSLLGKIIEAVDGNAPRLDFVHKNGKPMEVKGTDDLREPHRCYNNSVDVVMESMGKDGPRIDYVEGIVTEHGVPLAHAWNREGTTMVDHTVPDPQNHQYMGLVIPRRVWMDVMTSNSFGRGRGEGVLGNILTMKDKKRRDRYLRLIMEAN